MGNCGQGKDEQDTQVEKQLSDDKAVDRNIKKLLLLGAGGSGKSTLFKQLQNIHGGGFAARDRKNVRSQIHEQIVEAMKIMISKCEDWQEAIENNEFDDIPDAAKEVYNQNNNAFILGEDCSNDISTVSDTRNNAEFTNPLSEAMARLWQTPQIQTMFQLRNVICVPDSTEYFMNHIMDIREPSYIPSNEDLFLVRYRTTGMSEKIFEIDGTTFKICDVGGQRNERRKWIHFFDAVTAVIFVAALTCYDEAIFEDDEANSMIESLEVFDEHCNSQIFHDTAFILFLNKNDLFLEKAAKVPITTCFSGKYTGNHYKGPVPGQGLEDNEVVEAQYEFIKAEFESKNDNPEERQIYVHRTQATDPDNVNKVFNDVQHIVINWSLSRSGLL